MGRAALERGCLVVKSMQRMMMSGCLLAAVLPAFSGPGGAQARVQDTLTVFKAGDTARASAVNANFKLLLDRMNALAEANGQLVGKVDSLRKAQPSAPHMDSLEAEIARLKSHINLLNARMDTVETDLPHVHPVSQVTGLQDSLQAKVSAKGGPLKVCSGRTAPGAGWTDYNADGAYLEVDTEACGFSSPPQYFTSLGASTSHWLTTGVTSIYSPTATGFKVYVANQPWSATPVRPPASWGLYINWVAIGP